MDATTTTVEPVAESPQVADDPTRGPLLLGAILIAAGTLFVVFGRVTIVPFIDDERRRANLRHMWYLLSHNLPSVGHPDLVRIGFWILVSLIAVLCAAIILLAATVRDDDEAGLDRPA